jgi:hypothetical protein
MSCWRDEYAGTGGILKGVMLCKSGWVPQGVCCRCGICGIMIGKAVRAFKALAVK